MREIEPELSGLRQESGTLNDLPRGGAHLEKRINSDNGICSEEKAKGEKIELRARGRGVGESEDGGGEREGERGEAKEEEEVVEAPDLTLRHGGDE